MTQFEPITIDMGTSAWKVLYKKKSFFIPTFVATGPIKEKVNGVFDALPSTDSIDNITIKTLDGIRHVGNIAKRSEKPPWSSHNINRYTAQEFMEPMTLAAFSEAAINTNLASLTTAVPALWLDEKVYIDGKYIPIVDIIRDHFMNPQGFDIKRHGKSAKRVEVVQVNVITETKGLLYSFLLDKSGQPAIEDFMNLRIVVADIGQLTSCFDSFYALERDRASATSEDFSMGIVQGNLIDRVKAETGRTIKDWEVEDVISKGYVKINARGAPKKFDITNIYQDEISIAQRGLYSDLTKFIGNPKDVHYIIIGGGGAGVLGPIMQRNFPNVKIMDRHSTAAGLHRYGILVCQ